MKNTVALIYGGEGMEHNISLVSAKNVSRFIDRDLCDVISVLITEDGEWTVEEEGRRIPTFPAFINGEGGLFINGRIKKIDLVLPILHGEMGEDGVIFGALRAAHIRTLGCPTLAGALSSDKISSKFIAEALGIPTARWVFTDCEPFEHAIEKAEKALHYPMFIKPSSLGSSIGISKVENRDEFRVAYEKARALCERILIEEDVRAECELECAYLCIGKNEYFEIGEVCLDGKFYDFERKYESDTKTAPFTGDHAITDRVIKYSDALRRALGIRQISRIDFFLTRRGEVLFNEINSMPGMTETSLYPTLAARMGYPDGSFINALISEALR